VDTAGVRKGAEALQRTRKGNRVTGRDTPGRLRVPGNGTVESDAETGREASEVGGMSNLTKQQCYSRGDGRGVGKFTDPHQQGGASE